MKPYKVTLYVYASNEQEVKELEQHLYEFVDSKRKSGIAVTAKKLSQAIQKFKNNYFVNNYLR
jgi:hypothetical protein